MLGFPVAAVERRPVITGVITGRIRRSKNILTPTGCWSRESMSAAPKR